MGHKIGWRAAFYVALIPGLRVGLGALFIKEPEREPRKFTISARRSETEIRIG